jgi:hypothetical protein
VVKERERAPLLGTLPGDGYKLITDVFIETGPRGRIATWSLDIRKPRGESDRSRSPGGSSRWSGCRRSKACTGWR